MLRESNLKQLKKDILMKFDTKVVRSGISPDPSTGAIVPPIYQSATYVLDEVGKDKGYDYTRASKSVTFNRGFVGVSIQISLVLS